MHETNVHCANFTPRLSAQELHETIGVAYMAAVGFHRLYACSMRALPNER